MTDDTKTEDALWREAGSPWAPGMLTNREGGRVLAIHGDRLSVEDGYLSGDWLPCWTDAATIGALRGLADDALGAGGTLHVVVECAVYGDAPGFMPQMSHVRSDGFG